MAQPFGMQELPDRAALHLQPSHALKLLNELADGEVLLLTSCHQPRRMLAPKGLGLVPANLGWLHASCLPIARHPSDGGADSDPKPGRSLVARHPLGIDRRNNAFAQVHRIRFRHSCRPPAPAGLLNQNGADLGIPRFTEISTRSSPTASQAKPIIWTLFRAAA